MRSLLKGCMALALAMIFMTCNHGFEPKAEYHVQLVVFSILATNRAIQMARVYTTYNPDGINPSTNTTERIIADARVTLSDGVRTVTMVDTLISRPDTSRYRTPMGAYKSDGLVLQGGRTYTLTIESDSNGHAGARITLPSHATLSVNGVRVIESGAGGVTDEKITVTAYPGSGAAGAVIRMYVDYEAEHFGARLPGRVEVPERFPTDDLPSVETTYPQLRRLSGTATSVRFTKNGYQLAMTMALARHPLEPLTFKRVVFAVLQAETNLFSYYNIANAFFDRGSIRTDQPNHSNIDGGIGLFGGFTIDSVSYSLPENFPFNRK
ncbi:MAG: DUF4249 family protein [Bacteroidota bacterium]